jgi:hypothetical protein
MAGVGVLILALSYPLLRTDEAEEEGWREDASLDTRVMVLNGCGTEGIAEEVSSCLRDGGFDIVGTGNADAFDYERTIVIDRCGSMDKAQKVAEILQCEQVMLQRVRASASDVVVVVGGDWAKLRALAEWKRRTGWSSDD